MYVCKHCGYASRNESINYCNNIRCKYYGYNCDHEDGHCQRPQERTQCAPKCEPYRDSAFMCQRPMCEASAPQKCVREMPAPEKCMGEMPMQCNPAPMPMKDCPPMPAVNSCGMTGFATVPFQEFKDMYPIQKALMAGTVFGELDMPYTRKIIRRG